MTDLIERYLAAIARELPEAQRADITAELRDELMSGVEAKEDGLGRPLEREELENHLVEFGNPLLVAGRYRRTQHLIGPEMFPFWWAGLRASLLVVAAVYLVLAFIRVFAGGEADEVATRASESLTLALVFTFGAVTLFCAAVERWGKPGVLARWKPRNLPPARGRTKGRFEIMVELGMGFVALLWWTGVIHFRNVMPGVELRVDLAPVWTAYFWPILAYLLGELAVNTQALLRPGRVKLNAGLAIARNLAGAAILTGVIQAGHFVLVSADHIQPDVLATLQTNFDRGFRVGIGVAIGIFLWLAAFEAWRLRQFVRFSVGPSSRPA
ncbi:hypothetical protein [Phenylobacterium sp.]|uniref:hypothetical protein n=1 Tax=Phenylobacterium sp. TaxID=1871053 RepID=UPI002ED955F8